MYYFRFTERQRELLKSILKDNKFCFKYLFIDNYFALENESDVESCFNVIIDYFIRECLQSNYEPTNLGIEVEEINKVINYQLVLNNSEKEYALKNNSKYLIAKSIYLSCNGNKDTLTKEKLDKYNKLRIPQWLEEKWEKDFKNTKLEQQFKK